MTVSDLQLPGAPPDLRDPRAARTAGPYAATLAHPHALFPGEESEAHAREGTCPRCRSQLVAEPGIDPVTQFGARVVSPAAISWPGRVEPGRGGRP